MAAKKKALDSTDTPQPEVMHQQGEAPAEAVAEETTTQESGKASTLSIKGHAALTDAQLMTCMPSQYVAINAIATTGDTSVISDAPSAKQLETILASVKSIPDSRKNLSPEGFWRERGVASAAHCNKMADECAGQTWAQYFEPSAKATAESKTARGALPKYTKEELKADPAKRAELLTAIAKMQAEYSL